ncbi:fimbrial protein [Achromobacter sp. ES-001]|uniref:fimbrial protein n=1 Tax=Achromobacter sp. ES-001 TaxID=2860286 RepID=UPI002106C7D6|nr:fimbrial protein [Achromobacter sp. ES-001]
MVAPANWRRRLLHAALTAGMCCPLATALADTLAASPLPNSMPAQGAPVLVARGIGVLSPVQPIPVRPAPSIESRAVPLGPPPCGLRAAEPALDTSVQGTEDSGDEAIPGLNTGLSQGMEGGALACDDQVAGAADGNAPDDSGTSDSGVPDYSFALEESDIPRIPVVVISGVSRPTRPWFSSVSGQDGLRYGGDRNWVYRNTAGPSLTVGNINANAPAWGSTAPVGGLQIANWAGSAATVPEGSFGYSSSVGKLNRMDPAASSGAVDYGASVGMGSVRYGLTPALTVEGQMQSAPSLTTRGMGTTYAAGEYGTFQAGATQSSFDASNAWRYRFGYNVEVADAVNLGYTNEQIGAGFGDLSNYSGGVAAAPQSRNTLSAGVPIQGWGTFSGTYSGLHEGSVLAEQRVGLTHSMFVAPKVKLAVGADRDIVSGNYEWRANLSMPVDTFMRGTWLSW